VLRISCPVLALALLSGGWMQTAVAQTPAPGLTPHVDLTSSLDAGPGKPQFDTRSGGLLVKFPPRPAVDDGPLFKKEAVKEGGWKGLARLLEALTPDVDTAIPLTPSQITARIASMLNSGQNDEALRVIEKRSAQLEAQGALGADVQLMFLHGRALAALGRNNEAIDLYRNMTTLYPELPEPWNNLAAEYVKQGKLDMARDALDMALQANPNYGTAKANMGEVQLMLARQSFQRAAELGVSQASAKATETTKLLEKPAP